MRTIALILAFATVSIAADSDEVAKQKAAVTAAVAKLKLKGTTIAETPDLIVCTTLPEAKARTLADAAQKAVAVAKEGLQYPSDEPVFSGKLAMFVFTDNSELKSFVRQMEQRRSEGEAYSLSLRGATPFVVVSTEVGTKLVETELTSAASGWAAAAVLNKKTGVGGGAKLPEWLQIGYGRACVVRSEPVAKQAAYRAKVKTAVTAKGKYNVWAKDIWSGEKLAERNLIAGSFVEYLAFGPYSEKFAAFARATKPSGDNDATPSIDMALTSFEAKIEELDLGWKQWVIKGK